jgi:hypothetical protein
MTFRKAERAWRREYTPVRVCWLRSAVSCRLSIVKGLPEAQSIAERIARFCLDIYIVDVYSVDNCPVATV